MSDKSLTEKMLGFKVVPKSIMVNIDEIKVRDVERDVFFSEKYLKYLTGRSKSYITRISISRIEPGFYRRVSLGWQYCSAECSLDDIEEVMILIKGGYRPSLNLYHNMNKESAFDFVCPDDTPVLRAYMALGIKLVPVIVLESKKGFEESAFVIKGFKKSNRSYVHFIFSIEANTPVNSHSLLGEKLAINPVDDLVRLEEYMVSLRDEYREFHGEGGLDVHYHQLVFSMLTRAIEALEALKLLIAAGLNLQAANIVRSLYELSLTYHICWLSPHEITQFIQLSSMMSEKEWRKECEAGVLKNVAGKLDRTAAENLKNAQIYPFSLVRSVVEKSRLCPLGEDYYKDVYAFLSDIAHHDFSMAARYKGVLESGQDAVYDSDVRDSIMRIVDLCVTKMIIRMADDIGGQKIFLQQDNDHSAVADDDGQPDPK